MKISLLIALVALVMAASVQAVNNEEILANLDKLREAKKSIVERMKHLTPAQEVQLKPQLNTLVRQIEQLEEHLPEELRIDWKLRAQQTAAGFEGKVGGWSKGFTPPTGEGSKEKSADDWLKNMEGGSGSKGKGKGKGKGRK